ncbi:hypothetical protein RJ640_009649 [Escallonia rubra]|uniref:Uncharacterized protein n=1 Tax=Escallonia rubra TaxID=112253 RepID=A0AA88S1L4_9ASTE|nr:hypothetical protein RJ640_009649 [Escallonia rubra]
MGSDVAAAAGWQALWWLMVVVGGSQTVAEGPPGHRDLKQGHGDNEQLHQRHLQEAGPKVFQARHDFPEQLKFLSPLEVEELDAIGKDEEEEEHPTDMGEDHRYKEVMIITKVFLKEQIHPHFGSFRCCEVCLDITYLRRKYTVDRPSNWRTPIVPSPPYGDELQELSTVFSNTSYKCTLQKLNNFQSYSPDVGEGSQRTSSRSSERRT